MIDLATEALATKSKDLQIAAWLVEALVKRHGFAGCATASDCSGSCRSGSGQSLYPEVEDGDLESRAGSAGVVERETPAVAIREVPLTQSRDGENYSWLHWEESRAVDNLGRRNQAAMAAALADGKITGEQFDKAVEATSPGVLPNTL